MYKLLFTIVIVTGIVVAAAAVAAGNIACSKTGLETSCSVKFPDRLVVDDDSVYVGLENKLVQFDLELNPQAIVYREASTDAIIDCERYRQPYCGNYILTMLVTNLTDDDVSEIPDFTPLVNKTVLFICSTLGFSPQCQLCNANNISHCVNTPGELKLGYSPYDRRFNNVYTLTKDHVFYTGSSFDGRNGLQAVAKFPNPFTGAKFSLHTYTSETWRWLFNPTFISLYEVDQYIYFFWKEEAFEANRRVYTSVGRVCKSDKGLGSNSSSSSVFSTFVKARMTCSIPQDSNNRYPFYFNELHATHLMDNGDSPILYAVFSVPSNGPNSSAICTYSFGSEENSLTTVFDGDYLFGDSGSEAWTTVNNPIPFDCPNEGPNQRSSQDAEKYLLMEDSVQQSSPLPVYIETGAFITALVVDSVLWDGQELEVFYIGLSNGIVKQILQGVGEVELYATPSGNSVTKLVLHKSNGRKYCYITSDDNIAVIQLGHCDYYQTCSQCTNDIYCRWHGQSCEDDVNMAANITCPTPVPTTTTTDINIDATTVCQTSIHTVTIEKCSKAVVTPRVFNAANTGNEEEKTCNDLPIVIGASVGGVLLGFIIAAVMFITIYFIKRSWATPKESPTKQKSIESKEYDDDDAFAPPSADQLNKNYYSTHPTITNGRTNMVNMLPIRHPHQHPNVQAGRNRTESTKRLISISSDLYPDSPSPPSTLRMPAKT